MQIFHVLTFVPVYIYFKGKITNSVYFMRLLFFQQLFGASLYYKIWQFLENKTTRLNLVLVVLFFYTLCCLNQYVSSLYYDNADFLMVLHIIWDLEFLQIIFIVTLYNYTNSILVTPLYFSFYKD